MTLPELYTLFGLPSDCDEISLRQAYRRLMFENHPDRHPATIKHATAKTQELTAAYQDIQTRRKARSFGETPKDFPDLDSVSISAFSFAKVDLKKIDRLKEAFRKAWASQRRKPEDPSRSLRLIHAAVQAGWESSIPDLLLDTVMIDASSMLSIYVSVQKAQSTFINWSDFLARRGRLSDAIQILEDARTSGDASSEVAEELRKHYYRAAQGNVAVGLEKPSPIKRIELLEKYLALGPKIGYVYKHLAEAHFDAGNLEQAKHCLQEAYRLDPLLAGAKTITRRLGFQISEDANMKPQSVAKSVDAQGTYALSRTEQLPSMAQLSQWAADGDWRAVIRYTNTANYSPNFLPKCRRFLFALASHLETFSHIMAVRALEGLLHCMYWETREVAATALCKIGDLTTAELLDEFTVRSNSYDQSLWKKRSSYIRARLGHIPTLSPSACAEDVYEQAQKHTVANNQGVARFELEQCLATLETDNPLAPEIRYLLAELCADMKDTRDALLNIKPILPNLRGDKRLRVLRDIPKWLWSDLYSRPYDCGQDDDYLLGLNSHFELALAAEKPDEVLNHLRYTTRWLERLGCGEDAEWIRDLIRAEAPKTIYVDSDRTRYVRQVNISEILKMEIQKLSGRIRKDAYVKVKTLMRSQKNIGQQNVS